MFAIRYQQIPLQFLFEHQATLAGLGKIGLRSLKKTKIAPVDWQSLASINEVIDAPSQDLIEHYILWSGAEPDKYHDSIPPHMVSQWGLSFTTRLLLQTHYPLSQVINQGVSLKIHGKIPRTEKLMIQAKIAQVDERNGLARVSVQITTGTIAEPELVEALLHMAFILPHFEKTKRPETSDTKLWHTLGEWSTRSDDGLKFALLTGDFNPIHWVTPLAKLSNFGQKVLHGFGVFARSFELLPQPIQQIDVRFLKPVKLPSEHNRVETSTEQEQKYLRVVGSAGQICLMGQYS
ncbi:MaoC/PaaZ C-terminal domain-containing protein [Acinetobacter colistiniresistens]|uniref:MaoC/PaaZ C-terminal domain-containing protein n=1 Tax=Acinetobacter colistiniresistens TaxID=280145 RepID=UPI00211C5ECD|nr:MaoC/PaaZ C-terminal domain-containing protein [Acinetobacter colistiniresistens]UUM26444.1 MaoC/PaaZ C-terminal domain-containing protein [Acinetobacter colistiniresistens]